MTTSAHGSSTETPQGGRRHTGNSTAATHLQIFRHGANDDFRRRPPCTHGDPGRTARCKRKGQHHASRGCPGRTRSGPRRRLYPPVKSRRLTVANSDSTRGTRARRRCSCQRHALRMNGTPLRTARLRPVHDGHTRRDWTNSGGGKILRTATTTLRCYAAEGFARGSPRGCWWRARTLLETREDDGTVDEEEEGPRRVATARVRFGPPSFDLQGAND